MSKFKKMLSEPEQGEEVENVEDIQEVNDEDITESEETKEASSDIDPNEYEDVSEEEAVEKKPKRAEKKAQLAASRKRKESNAKQNVDQVASYPQKETQKTQKTQKTKLSEHITLLAAIGAVIFSALAVFSNNSLSTKQYNATTQGLWKAQKGQFAVLRSESSDALTQLNDKLTALDATQSDIKTAMKRLNENVQTLNKNLNQVQENMLGQMKQLGTPDLSKIESAITAMNTNKNDVTSSQQSHQEDRQAQHFDETQIVDKESKANEANKENKENEKNKKAASDLKDTKSSRQNIDDKQQNKIKTVKATQHTLLYLGNTPNGAVIKLDDEYLTVQVGQKTVVGTVTLISNKQIVIGNTSYVYQAG
ncbi:hypothetical protein [Cysteiniphilum litorale]|uniref:hypothetical protein n=1 Tax=Cysteiniphilum litorale TaxID=2056700 RepID=UPI003F882DEF